MISIRNLSHRIGASEIISSISVDIPGSGITALIGPNGAGKSTLLSLIAKLIPIQQGTIRVDDIDVAQTPTQRMARKLAVLDQNSHVATRLTVSELVGFGRWPHHHGRPDDVDAAVVREAIDLFELSPIAHRYIDELSGGQRQRAFVAMCYAQSTDWLLLDEPLSNLDPRHAVSLMTRLHGVSRPNHGSKGIVIVLHDINYAATWADRVVIMKSGEIKKSGETDDVLDSATLSDTFEVPINVAEVAGRRVVLHHGSNAPLS